MERELDIAVVGAEALVGESVLNLLEERHFPVGSLYVLQHGESEVDSVRFKEKSVAPQAIEAFDFSQAQIAFFAGPKELAEQYAPLAADAGCIVIDVCGAFRFEPDVPMVIAGINDDRLADYMIRNIISLPSATSTMVWSAAMAIHRAVGIEAVTITALQSVSGKGKAGVDELAKQTAQLLNARQITSDTYRKQIAFNVLPESGALLDNGFTQDEMSLLWETHRLLDDTSVAVTPSCIVVPVFHGDSAQVTVETQAYIGAEEACDIWRQSAAVELVDAVAQMDYATPVTDTVGSENVFVSRVREDAAGYQKLSFWVTADNIRVTTAKNAVLLAEQLATQFL